MDGKSTEAILTIQASDAAIVDAQLDAAEAIAQARALRDPRRPGILITRSAPGLFTIALTPEVPFGLTMEQKDW